MANGQPVTNNKYSSQSSIIRHTEVRRYNAEA